MAVGDITIFDEALERSINGDWASTDNFYCAVIQVATTPTASDAVPHFGGTGTTDLSTNEVTDAGTYTAGGTDLGALSALATQTGGTMTFDSSTNPTWAANGSNDVDARWAIIYNNTDATKDALAFVDLGTVNMQLVPLAITWSGTGIYTKEQV